MYINAQLKIALQSWSDDLPYKTKSESVEVRGRQ